MSDFECIEDLPKKELAVIWCELNRWNWPDQIPDEEAIAEDSFSKNPRRSKIMRDIEEAVGHKICNREWNINSMSDEEHEEFYGKNFGS